VAGSEDYRLAVFLQQAGAARLDPRPVLHEAPASGLHVSTIKALTLLAADLDGDLAADIFGMLGSDQPVAPTIRTWLQTARALRADAVLGGTEARTFGRQVPPAAGLLDADGCADVVVPTSAGLDVYATTACRMPRAPRMAAPLPAHVAG